MQRLQLGFFASHDGSNMRAIIDACRAGLLSADIRLVISNNHDSSALEYGREAGFPSLHLSRRTHPDPEALDRTILGALVEHGVDHVVLAGYLRPLGPLTVSKYRGRILNIHPALLPRYGGSGMYGMHVHEAVLAAGDTETGVTVHLADDEYDHGPIVAQKRVPVLSGDTPETLAARVLVAEHAFFPATLHRIAMGDLKLDRIWSGAEIPAARARERRPRFGAGNAGGP